MTGVPGIAERLTRAAAHVDEAARRARVALELPLPDADAGAPARAEAASSIDRALRMGVAEARLAIEHLSEGGAPLDDAKRAVEHLTRVLDAPAERWIAHRATLPPYRDAAPLLEIQRDRLLLRAELEQLDPGVARERLTKELDDIVLASGGRPHEAEQWRIAVTSGLPEHLRPQLPPAVNEAFPFQKLVARGRRPASDRTAEAEYGNLRIAAESRRLAATPGVTRQLLAAEVDTILLTPDHAITQGDMERLSIIAGLDDQLRPVVMTGERPLAGAHLESIAAFGWLPRHSKGAADHLDLLRIHRDALQLAADPSMNRSKATRELLDLLMTPTPRLGRDTARGAAVLLRLPDRLRPPAPPWRDGQGDLKDLVFAMTLRESAERWDTARDFLVGAAPADDIVAVLTARLQDGHPVPFEVLPQLQQRDPALLMRIGIRVEDLREQALAVAVTAEHEHLRPVAAALRFLQQDLARLELPTSLAAFRDQTVELAARNVARFEGKLVDGFAGDPDYAELGRTVANVRMLHAARSQPAAARSLPDAAPTLSW